MKKFNKGDKVVVISSYEEQITPGMTGVVVEHKSYSHFVVVDFGPSFDGWSHWGLPSAELDFDKEHYLTQFSNEIQSR